MKVVYPKYIKKWILSGMNFNIWPLTISVVQLFVMALWIAISLAVFNWISKSGSKALWLIFAIFIMMIFVVITFFKISELTLIPFLAKMIRNKFFDTNKKFQVNYEKNNPVEILIKESNTEIEKANIQHKEKIIDENLAKRIEKWWLI